MTTTDVTSAPSKENWGELKGKLRSKFTILKDADVDFEESKKEEMLTGVQKKIGINHDVLTSIISSL